MPSEYALRLVKERDEKHPPPPMPEALERELLRLWGPMQPPPEKVKKKRRK